MRKIRYGILILSCIFSLSGTAQAAYQSRFDALNFTPAVDDSDYFTIYGTDMLAPGQGHVNFYFDYANRPLQFVGTGGFAGQRQSVIDHMIVMNSSGAIGVTDWFEVGLNIPAVLYNWFYSDEPAAAPSGTPDKGAMMGDIQVVTKFRLLDIEKTRFGVALVPYATLPTGDVVRYTGSGQVTGGANLVLEAQLHERFNMALNAGYVVRDDVTRHGANVNDQLTFGLAGNIKISPNWQAIIEGFGSTVVTDFFNTNTTPLEAGAGIRYYFGESGFAMDLGGTGGIIDGIGSPRFRAFTALRWTSPVHQPCPELPPPDPRIKGNKIVLWGKIFYDTNKATIKPVSFPVLDDVVDVMQKNQQITLVEVQGHTDARASDSYNLKLSQARAESAMNYLISKGVSASRLRAVGYGESRPIASNDTVEGMSQNRRTEFIIISSVGGQNVVTPTTTTYTAPTVSTSVSTTSENVSVTTPTSVSVTTTTTSSAPPPATNAPGEFPNFSYPPPSP